MLTPKAGAGTRLSEPMGQPLLDLRPPEERIVDVDCAIMSLLWDSGETDHELFY